MSNKPKRATYSDSPYSYLISRLGSVENQNKKLPAFEQKAFVECPDCDCKLYNKKQFYKHIEDAHSEERRHKYDYSYGTSSHSNRPSTLISTQTNYFVDEDLPSFSHQELPQIDSENEMEIDEDNDEMEYEDIDNERVYALPELINDLEMLRNKAPQFSRCELIDNLMHDMKFKELMEIVLLHKMDNISSEKLKRVVADMLDWSDKSEKIARYKKAILSERYQEAFIIRTYEYYIKAHICEIASSNLQMFPFPFKFCYLSLITICEKMLTNQSLVMKILNERNQKSSNKQNEVIESIEDALIFSRIKDKLKILLFIDDAQISPSSGLNANNQKFTFIYACFEDTSIDLRTHCRHMEIILMANRSEMKRRNIDIIDVLHSSPLRSEIEYLSQSGIDVVINGQRETICATISGLLGDNLGIHEALGFGRAFQNVAYICRECATRGKSKNGDDIQNLNIHPRKVIHPDKQTQSDIDKFGRLRPFVLNNIDGITRWNISPPDLGHDVLEGVSADILELNLTSLTTPKTTKQGVTAARLAKSVVEKRFSEFGFYEGRLKLVWKGAEGYKIRGKAIQKAETFLKFDVIFFEEVQRDWPEFQLFLVLKKFILLAFSQSFTSDKLTLMTNLSLQVMKQYKKVYINHFGEKKPEKTDFIYCKLHKLSHYADMTRLYGPLNRFNNLKFERKHQFPKRIARFSNCFINLAVTVTNRHQVMRAVVDEKIKFSKIDFSQKVVIQSEQPWLDTIPPDCSTEEVPSTMRPFLLNKNVIRKVLRRSKLDYWFHAKEFYIEKSEGGRICCFGNILTANQPIVDGRPHSIYRYGSLKMLKVQYEDKFVWLESLNYSNDFMFIDKTNNIWLVEWIN